MQPQEVIDGKTLALIKVLQDKEYLQGFRLAGGTAIALYLGHRRSNDVDLFSNDAFDASAILENLQQDMTFNLSFTAANTLKGEINNVKVDLIAHRYPYLNPVNTISGIQALSLPDLIAMKLNAVSVSGQRSKDFIDLFYLSGLYSIAEMLAFYKIKYSQDNNSFILKSLVYFDEVDLSDWPVLIKDPSLKWDTVKKHLTTLVLEYTRKFRGLG